MLFQTRQRPAGREIDDIAIFFYGGRLWLFLAIDYFVYRNLQDTASCGHTATFYTIDPNECNI